MPNAHLEEHKVVTLLGDVVSEGSAFANAALCSESGPSGEFGCIHGDYNERGGVEAGWDRDKTRGGEQVVTGRALMLPDAEVAVQSKTRVGARLQRQPGIMRRD